MEDDVQVHARSEADCWWINVWYSDIADSLQAICGLGEGFMNWGLFGWYCHH